MTQTPCHSNARGDVMGLVKTRRLAAMQKQQRAKAGMKPPVGKGGGAAYLRKARGPGEMPEKRHFVGIRPGG